MSRWRQGASVDIWDRQHVHKCTRRDVQGCNTAREIFCRMAFVQLTDSPISCSFAILQLCTNAGRNRRTWALRALVAMSEKGPSNGSARNFRTTFRASRIALIAKVDPSPPPLLSADR